MTEPSYAICLENVSKHYRHYDRPFDRIRELLTREVRHVERHSVSGLSLTISRGEVVGIIGRNGAGKSTLLKMIAGRLEPASGRVSVAGNVAAILELGTGFHPDLSGRENVRMGGLCLGLSKRKIEEELDRIIAFSEMEDVIDMPFRTYSSGMQARLTFATAVTVDPDILIIDEALSVGDNRFQLKSFDRIREFRDQGKTILLVTHGMDLVTSFCDRAILLDKGSIIADGDPKRITSIYHHLQFGGAAVGAAAQGVAKAQPEVEKSDKPTLGGYRYGQGPVRIALMDVFDAGKLASTREMSVGQAYDLILECEAQQAAAEIFCGFLIRDPKGEIVFGSDSTLVRLDGELSRLEPGCRRRVAMRITAWLAPGIYFLTGAVTAERGKQSDMWFDAFQFRVVGPPVQHTNSRAFLDPSISVTRLSAIEVSLT
jgi:lipopolysaccharide transport system ATP-binding protein